MAGLPFRPLAAIAAACVFAACSSQSVTTAAPPVAPGEPLSQATGLATFGDAASAGVTVFPIASHGTLQDMRVGTDGKLYYTMEPSGDGHTNQIGVFDFSTQAGFLRQVPYGVSNIAQDAGGVWVTTFGTTVYRYTNIHGNPVAISTNAQNNLTGGIHIANDGSVWFADGGAQVGKIEPSTNAVTLYPVTPPPNGGPPYLIDSTIGSDGSFWALDSANAGVFRVSTSGPKAGSSAFFPLPLVQSAAALAIASGGDNIYTAAISPQSSRQGALDRGVAGSSPAFMPIGLPPIVAPEKLTTASGKVYFQEKIFSGLGIVDARDRSVVVLPLEPKAVPGIVADSAGNPWLACVQAFAPCLERVVLSSQWSAYPGQSITLYTIDRITGHPLPPGLIGIGETGNSGPFTVRSSNVSVCTAHVIAGFAHDVQVDPVAAGTCTVTISDAHARQVPVAVTVANGQGSPQ